MANPTVACCNPCCLCIRNESELLATFEDTGAADCPDVCEEPCERFDDFEFNLRFRTSPGTNGEVCNNVNAWGDYWWANAVDLAPDGSGGKYYLAFGIACSAALGDPDASCEDFVLNYQLWHKSAGGVYTMLFERGAAPGDPIYPGADCTCVPFLLEFPPLEVVAPTGCWMVAITITETPSP